jgi:hypothetical protein
MKPVKHFIQVRRYPSGQSHYRTDKFELVETVARVLRAEQIGNFNPIFCTYKGKRTLVHSDSGDLSDPFRRDAGYVTSLFIEV